MTERYPGKPAGKKTQPKTKRPNHIITVILGVAFVLLAVGVPQRSCTWAAAMTWMC